MSICREVRIPIWVKMIKSIGWTPARRWILRDQLKMSIVIEAAILNFDPILVIFGSFLAGGFLWNPSRKQGLFHLGRPGRWTKRQVADLAGPSKEMVLVFWRPQSNGQRQMPLVQKRANGSSSATLAEMAFGFLAHFGADGASHHFTHASHMYRVKNSQNEPYVTCMCKIDRAKYFWLIFESILVKKGSFWPFFAISAKMTLVFSRMTPKLVREQVSSYLLYV